MRPESEYRTAIEMIRGGINDSEIGRRMGIPRGTIRDWRVGLESKSGGRTKHWSGRRTGTCPRCDGTWMDPEAYAYLLGMYLGDGCLSLHPREVYKLRVFSDRNHPNIINEIATHITIVSGSERVGFASKKGCVEVFCYWKHWICLFPQHAPGKKHDRRIELAPWQARVVGDHSKALIRGLIHSDGTRHINEVSKTLKDGVKRYRYSRYMFANYSSDILDIFTNALDRLDVHWTRTTEQTVAVSRRADVSFLDSFVGPKG